MAASTVAAPVSRPRRLARIIFRSVLIVFLLAFLGIAGTFIYFYWMARAALPQLDGRVSVAGLQGPVDVVRSPQGVPHVTASSLEDLFVAQGYITAQDRLWQMDMTRRAAGGEMAEILPASSAPAPAPSRSTAVVRKAPSWVEYDKRQRTLRLRAVSERVAGQLSPRDRTFFEAYARGVNAYIDQHRDNLPVEFRILRYSPRNWTAADSILVGIAMSQLLNPQYDMEYWRGKLSEHLSPELLADLYPLSSVRDHPPGDDKPLTSGRTASKPEEDLQAAQASALAAAPPLPLADCESCVPGSNNWVVSGAHTV